MSTVQNKKLPNSIWIDDPGQVAEHLRKYSLYIMIVLLFLLIFCSVSLFFVYYFSQKFYKTVSSGQDRLCNFYTCSGPGECDNYPKIILPDGKQVCAPA